MRAIFRREPVCRPSPEGGVTRGPLAPEKDLELKSRGASSLGRPRARVAVFVLAEGSGLRAPGPRIGTREGRAALQVRDPAFGLRDGPCRLPLHENRVK